MTDKPKSLSILNENFNNWKESVEEYLICKDLDRFVFNADGPLPTELENGGTQARKAMAELWLLLDPDIQCQVKSAKTGPAALWRELIDRFSGASTRVEVQKANLFLTSPQAPTCLAEVPKFLANVFSASDTLKRNGTAMPCSTLASILIRHLPPEFEKAVEDLVTTDNSLTVSKLSKIFQARYETLKLRESSQPSAPAPMTAYVVNNQYAPNSLFCSNCNLNHPSPCPHPHRTTSIFEFWKKNNIGPSVLKRRAYEHWLSLGCPPPRRNMSTQNSNQSHSNDDIGQMLKQVLAYLQNNKSQNSAYPVPSSNSSDNSLVETLDFDYLLKVSSISPHKDSWIMDTGASKSYTFNESLFIPGSLVSCTGVVTIGNGQALGIKGRGDVYIPVARNNIVENVKLKNVLFVPELFCNLLSLGVATERGCYFEGSSDGIKVYKSSPSRLTLVGKRLQGSGIVELIQYSNPDPSEQLCIAELADPDFVESLNCLITATSRTTPKLGSLYYWHITLNHRNPDDIKAMARNNSVSGLQLTDEEWPGCTSCNLCKISRTAQSSYSVPHSAEFFHLDTIVGDVIGRIPISTLNDEFYASIFMDLRTRYMSVQLHKFCTSESVLTHLLKFIKLIERQPDFSNSTRPSRKIRCVRTDMASYYTSDIFTSALSGKGIIQQFSAPYFPEQNGHAERLNRTLIEATRTIMHQSHLPFQLWGEVLRSVAQVYNQTSHSAVNNSTPYELLFGDKPSVNLLRPIGINCHYMLEYTSKFEQKAQQGKLLGYHPFTKAYRIWDQFDNKVRISYNVKFDNVDVANETRPRTSESHHNNPDFTTSSPLTSSLPTAPSPSTNTSATSQNLPAESSHTYNLQADQNNIAQNVDTEESTPPVPEQSPPETNNRPQRAAKERCNEALIENRHQLFVSPIIDLDDVSGCNTFESCIAVFANQFDAIDNVTNHSATIDTSTDKFNETFTNQSDIIEIEFDNNRYNFNVDMIPNLSEYKAEEYALLHNQAMSPESPTVAQALQGPDAENWKSAINQEFDTLWNTGTFETIHRYNIPAGQKTITAKIHLRLKHDPVRDLTQHKARVVVRGFSQVPGIDFNEVYSPVASFKSILMLLTIGASKDFEMHQMDFNSAFLNAEIKEEVYVEPIGTFDKRIPQDHVYKLQKTLYGLKQSPREWWLLLEDSLKELGWTPTLTDNCVFFRKSDAEVEYLAVYVDDIIIISPTPKSTASAKSQLASLFKSKDLGELSYVLGVRINRDRKLKRVLLDQKSLIDKYVHRFGISTLASTPGFWKSVSSTTESKPISKSEAQMKIGALLHLSTRTRPDITFEVNRLGRSIATPHPHTAEELERIFAYLRSTSTHKLILDGTKPINVITTFTDADWGGKKTQNSASKSTSGSITFIGESPICWSSKRQTCISMSTMESELIALSSGCQDALWARNLLRELLPTEVIRINVFCDNLPTVLQSKNLLNKPVARHIDLRFHFVRDLIKKKLISLSHVRGKENPSDLLTKSLGSNLCSESASRCKVLPD